MAKAKKKKDNIRLELEQPDQGIMSPLDLKIIYQSPRSEMDLLPFLDLVLIGFLFFMLSSRLVYAPGVVVDLPTAQQENLRSVLVSDVLTVSQRGGSQLFFFRGGIYNFDELKALSESEDLIDPNSDSVILIKMAGEMPIQLQAELVGITQAMGFSKVQIAVEPLEGI